MNLQISFPAVEALDDNGNVRFPVVINGRRAGCKITVEALQDKFGMRDADSLKGFKLQHHAIESQIKGMIQANPDAPTYEITTN